MKNLKLRKQIADLLRHLKKVLGYYPKRETVESYLSTYASGAHLIDMWNEFGNDEYIVIRANSYEDHDGFTESELSIIKLLPQNDVEYFETLCSFVRPTPYQIEEYQQYLRLKHKFGE